MTIYYLEYSSPNDDSHKFYEIILEQENLQVRFGKIGTQGQRQIKTYPTPETAQKEAGKKLQEKQRKGYQLITPSPEKPTVSKTPSLIPEIIELDKIPMVWRFDSGFSSFGIALEGEFCWLGNEKGRVIKIDKNGQMVAQYQLPNAVKCIVTDDIWIYVGCDRGNVYDMTGKIPYVAYQIEQGLDIFCLDIYEGILGVSDANGGLTKIDPEGEILWNRLSPGKMGWMLCSDAQGFYHGHSKGVTMYEGESGRQIWHQSTVGKVLFGCQKGDRLYVATTGKQVMCFHKNGELLQVYPCESSVYCCAVDNTSNYIFAGDNSGFIYCFNQQKRLWKVSTNCGSALSMQFAPPDRLYIATNQGILACIDVSMEGIKAAIQGQLPTVLTVENVIKEQQITADKTTENSATSILLECFRQGERLRVRVLSDGYHQDWMVQFPKHLRQEGDRYIVPEVREAKQGNFYRIYGDIQRLIKD